MTTIVLMLLGMLQTTTSDVRLGSVDVPPAIARYALPYLQCTVDGSNADPRMPSGDPLVLRAIDADAIAACAGARQKAFEDSDEALRRDPAYRDKSTRHAAINRVLDQFEGSFKSIVREVELSAPAPADTLRRPSYRRPALAGSFDIPDEIAPAVLPYMACLAGSSGAPVRTPDGVRDHRFPAFVKGTDCAPYRKVAAKNADKMLRQLGRRSRKERKAFIETTLAGAEAFTRANAVEWGN